MQRAAELMRLTRELDTQTLRYDWFIRADGNHCEVRDGYADADGLFEHNACARGARDVLRLSGTMAKLTCQGRRAVTIVATRNRPLEPDDPTTQLIATTHS